MSRRTVTPNFKPFPFLLPLINKSPNIANELIPGSPNDSNWVQRCDTGRHIQAVPWSFIYITPWSWALLERSLVVWTLDSFPAFYGTRRFNTEFTRALSLSLSWARPMYQVWLKPLQAYKDTNYTIYICCEIYIYIYMLWDIYIIWYIYIYIYQHISAISGHRQLMHLCVHCFTALSLYSGQCLIHNNLNNISVNSILGINNIHYI
jgi:hypothetical protein